VGARKDFALSPVTKKKPVDAPEDPPPGCAAPKISSDDLILWCQSHLGAMPAAELFTTGHLSLVMGLRLSDGREVVIKARHPARRLSGCYVAQDILHATGFPCPAPLVAPAPLGALSATAERYVPGGEPLAAAPHTTELYASALARLLACVPAPTELPSVEPRAALGSLGPRRARRVARSRRSRRRPQRASRPAVARRPRLARPCPPGQCNRSRRHRSCGLGSHQPALDRGAAPRRPRLGQHRCPARSHHRRPRRGRPHRIRRTADRSLPTNRSTAS